MTRVLIGILVILVTAVSVQSWRLNSAQENNAVLQANIYQLDEGLTAAAESFTELQATRDSEIQLFARRANQREQRIYVLQQQNKQLAAAIDPSGCLDSPIPIDIAWLLRTGEGGNGPGAYSSSTAGGPD